MLLFVEAGTSTPVIVYADEDLMTQLPNPVEADGFGLFPDIFLVPDVYDIYATTAEDVPLWESVDFTVETIPVLSPNYFSLIDGVYYPAIAINAQTGTGYTVDNNDRAAMITFNNNSGGTITLPAPSGSNFPNKWYCYISNIGSGDFTVTSVANINGVANFSLSSNSFSLFVSNGTTWSAGASANFNQVFTKPGGTLTVTANAITIGAFSEYLVNTSGGAQTLNTINGGSSGKELVLKISSASNALTITSAGNIAIPAGQDIVLSALQDNVLLRYDDATSKWDVQAYQNIGTKLPAFTTPDYVSSEITITSAATDTLPHSLGARPKLITATLICKVIDAGYAVNDEVPVSSSGIPQDHGVQVWTSDTTNIKYVMGGDANVFSLLDNTGQTTGLTNTSWKLVIKAYK